MITLEYKPTNKLGSAIFNMTAEREDEIITQIKDKVKDFLKNQIPGDKESASFGLHVALPSINEISKTPEEQIYTGVILGQIIEEFKQGLAYTYLLD